MFPINTDNQEIILFIYTNIISPQRKNGKEI